MCKRLLTVVSLFMVLSINAYAYGYGEVNTNSLNVRSGASKESDIITNITYGTGIKVVSAIGDWYKVKINDSIGYAAKEYIDLTAYPGSVNYDFLNVRDNPSTETGNIIGKLNKKDSLTILERDGLWYGIEYNNSIAYVHSDYVYTEFGGLIPTKIKINSDLNLNSYTYEKEEVYTDSSDETNSSGDIDAKNEYNDSSGNIDVSGLYSDYKFSQVTSDEILDSLYSQLIDAVDSKSDESTVNRYLSAITGMEYIGATYVYGGTSFLTGIDCSSFTQQIMSNYGVKIPRTSLEQSLVGENVRLDDIQVGDLVFFGKDNEPISHVGIYVGHDRMVSSANEATGVTIDNIFRFGDKKLRYIKRNIK